MDDLGTGADDFFDFEKSFWNQETPSHIARQRSVSQSHSNAGLAAEKLRLFSRLFSATKHIQRKMSFDVEKS